MHEVHSVRERERERERERQIDRQPVQTNGEKDGSDVSIEDFVNGG